MLRAGGPAAACWEKMKEEKRCKPALLAKENDAVIDGNEMETMLV